MTAVYLPLARLLNMYVAATKNLYEITEDFLGHEKPKVPYLIGIAGGVAVGKSTTSRVLQALLSRWPEHRKVEIEKPDIVILEGLNILQANPADKKKQNHLFVSDFFDFSI